MEHRLRRPSPQRQIDVARQVGRFGGSEGQPLSGDDDIQGIRPSGSTDDLALVQRMHRQTDETPGARPWHVSARARV